MAGPTFANTSEVTHPHPSDCWHKKPYNQQYSKLKTYSDLYVVQKDFEERTKISYSFQTPVFTCDSGNYLLRTLKIFFLFVLTVPAKSTPEKNIGNLASWE